MSNLNFVQKLEILYNNIIKIKLTSIFIEIEIITTILKLCITCTFLYIRTEWYSSQMAAKLLKGNGDRWFMFCVDMQLHITHVVSDPISGQHAGS